MSSWKTPLFPAPVLWVATIVPTVPCGPYCGGVVVASGWFPGSNMLKGIAAHNRVSPGSTLKNFAAVMKGIHRYSSSFLSCMCKGTLAHVFSLWRFCESLLTSLKPEWHPSPDLARPK